MTDEQIKDEAIKYCNSLDFTGDKGLNEKGRDKIREWCQQDFIAGANWMQEQEQIKISSNSVLSEVSPPSDKYPNDMRMDYGK